jgi:hypothetical protein
VQYAKCAKAFRLVEQTKGKPKEPKRQQKVKGKKKNILFLYIGKGSILKPF